MDGNIFKLGDRVTCNGKVGTVIHGGYYEDHQIQLDDGTIYCFIDNNGNQKYSKAVWTKVQNTAGRIHLVNELLQGVWFENEDGTETLVQITAEEALELLDMKESE